MHENVEKIELLAIFSSMNFRDHRVIERCLRTRRRKRGTRSAVGENVGASGYRSPASSVVIDPCSPCLSLSLLHSLCSASRYFRTAQWKPRDPIVGRARRVKRIGKVSFAVDFETRLLRSPSLYNDNGRYAWLRIRANWGYPRHNAESHPFSPGFAKVESSTSPVDHLSRRDKHFLLFILFETM